MQILVDTNVLLRAAQSTHVQRPAALAALSSCRTAGHRLVVVPQNVYEFWVVVTRPTDQNGLGLAAEEADRRTTELLDLFTLLRDERTVFDHWQQLVKKYGVRGKSAHDARLVAAMKRHGVTHLLTFNLRDFSRYDEVSTLAPEEVANDGVVSR